MVEPDLFFRVRLYARVADDPDCVLLPVHGQEQDVLVHAENLLRHVSFPEPLPRQVAAHGSRRCRYIIAVDKAVLDQGMIIHTK